VQLKFSKGILAPTEFQFTEFFISMITAKNSEEFLRMECTHVHKLVSRDDGMNFVINAFHRKVVTSYKYPLSTAF
jgi:hypothetical protein